MFKFFIRAIAKRVTKELQKPSRQPAVFANATNALGASATETMHIQVVKNAYLVNHHYNTPRDSETFVYLTPQEVAQHVEASLLRLKMGV